MQYEWWSHEDYRANEYTMLTPDEVYKHFYDAIGSYNELEYKNPVYIEPKILCKYSDIMMDKISQTCITNIICGWNANYFTNFGFEISDEDIKLFIEGLNSHERCHLIVEKPQGFIQFTTETRESKKHFMIRRISFEYLPRLER